jgi:hypothetical protein
LTAKISQIIHANPAVFDIVEKKTKKDKVTEEFLNILGEDRRRQTGNYCILFRLYNG